MKKFETQLAKFNNNPLWSYHVQVPVEIANYFKKEKQKRVLVEINAKEKFHAAIMSDGDDYYFIYMNAERRKKLKLRIGSEIKVKLSKDESKYGMDMPEELSEIIKMDKAVDDYFHALTPGKQRNLIYLVNLPKSQEKKLEKAIVITEFLKTHKGKLDFKLLHQAFRDYGK